MEGRVLMSAKVAGIELLSCGAGWRNYYFVKLTTTDGIVGWSEYSEDFGCPGVGAIIRQIAPRIIGRTVNNHERIYFELVLATKPASGGLMAQALGAIENALLDAKAKSLGVPCYELLGGKIRDRVLVYWSHCATWRISRRPHYQPEITDVEGIKSQAREVCEKGFKALKTNICYYRDGKPERWSAGWGTPFEPSLNLDRRVIKGVREHLETMQRAAGADVGVLVDLNFHGRTESYLKLLREIRDLELFWVEIDMFDAKALAYIRNHSSHPIASGETLMGLQEYLPYFENQALDVAIIDVPWNGAWQSMKIAASADAHDVNVAPHNFYGHLCTMISAHFAAATPNLRIVETDIDRIALDDKIFTHAPDIVDGALIIPDRAGWGTEPNEDVLRSLPPNSGQDAAGLITYGQQVR
jgi:galactonate dehydratase